MRSDRLLAITMLIADGRLHTAGELSNRFEVSERTIYRDMEALCEAGIPVVALAGKEGGYRVSEGWSVDRSVLTPDELPSIVAALGGIETIGGARTSEALGKLRALLKAPAARSKRQWIYLELAPGKRENAYIPLLRRAIEERRVVRISYCTVDGVVTERRIEPLAVVYTWNAWFLYAWCRLRSGYRLFKLVRIADLRLSLEGFKDRGASLDDAPWRKNWPEEPFYPLVLRFSASAAPRADEYFGPDSVEVLDDGGRLVRANFPENDWTIGLLMGFGPGLEVVSPERVRLLLAERAAAIARLNAVFPKSPLPSADHPVSAVLP
jgi:predicted DNA-binding transcriptional regulator YafY